MRQFLTVVAPTQCQPLFNNPNILKNLVYLVKPPGNIKTILPLCSLIICKNWINGGLFFIKLSGTPGKHTAEHTA